jgi:hypothetical protein
VYNVAHAACCRDTGIGLGFVHLWVYKLVGLHAVGLGACDVDSVRVVLMLPAIEILVSTKNSGIKKPPEGGLVVGHPCPC